MTTSVSGQRLTKLKTPTTCLLSVLRKAPNQPPCQSVCITRRQQTLRRMSNMTTTWSLILRPSRDETGVMVVPVLLRSSCLILCCSLKETGIHAAIHHAVRDKVVGTMMMQITLNSRKLFFQDECAGWTSPYPLITVKYL